MDNQIRRICRHCIEAIRSHGERVLVGEYSDYDTCEWCEEPDEVFDCIFEED